MEVSQVIQGSDCNGHVSIDFADPCCYDDHHKEIIVAIITRTIIYREGDQLLIREQDLQHLRSHHLLAQALARAERQRAQTILIRNWYTDQ